MKRNYGRDSKILFKVMKNQSKIISVLDLFECDFSQSSKGLCSNEYAFDLCALYMLRIGENLKLLSDSSKKELSKVINTEVLKLLRNMVIFGYEAIDKVMLQSYVQQMVSKDILDVVYNRHTYCLEKKRAKKEV